ncbi:hypothetical protein LPJ61_000134 [Coemansia biformis]|uniref:Peptidase S1 domain-containing protein n=1 Tax=Coemansia biformis TaxID=1286918 RepID=A0A9W8D1X6_9FUNG|nr:hypothetical protein LPJ61_000134 [Coemansia biformis]
MGFAKQGASGAKSWLSSCLAVAVAVLALPAGGQGASLMPRIMGGSDANYDDYRFIVYMYNSVDKTFCGGSIVSDDWILTAAHCVKEASGKDITVFVGQAEYALDMAKGTKAAQIHSHPQYNDQSMVNDIALVRMPSPVKGNVVSVNIDTSSVGDGVTLRALGWGYTSPSGSKASKKLQQGDLKTLTKQQCGPVDTSFTGNDGARICVAADAGPDTCPGDSGGPLVRTVGGKTVLTGLTSFGTAGPGKPITSNCGAKGMVSIFTHVNHFKSFIDSTTGGLREVQGDGKSDG